MNWSSEMDRWIENRFIVLIYRNYITKYSGRISVLFRGIFIESFAGKMQKKKNKSTDWQDKRFSYVSLSTRNKNE